MVVRVCLLLHKFLCLLFPPTIFNRFLKSFVFRNPEITLSNFVQDVAGEITWSFDLSVSAVYYYVPSVKSRQNEFLKKSLRTPTNHIP